MNLDIIDKIGGLDNFKCVIDALEIVKHSVQYVYTAEILKDKNTTCPVCQYDFILRATEFETNKDLTKYAFAAIVYDLLEGRANCTRLAALIMNLLINNKDFSHKSKLMIISNYSIDHTVLMYRNLDLESSVIIDPFSMYYNSDYVLNTLKNFILKTQNDKHFKTSIEKWNSTNRYYNFYKNIPVPILERRQDNTIAFTQEARTYEKTLNIDFDELLRIDDILWTARMNKKGPH